MHPDELTRLVDRELKRLPAPRAPRTLLPRVMAAVGTRPREEPAPGWWRRWPLAARVAAAAAVLASVAAAWWWGGVLEGRVGAALAESALVRFLGVLDIWRQAAAVTEAAQSIWRLIVQPFVWVVLPVVLLMWMACVAFGAALSRVALGGATQS